MESSAESGTGASGPHRGERDGNRTLRRRSSTPESSGPAPDGQIPTTPGRPAPARPTTVSTRPTRSAVVGAEGERHVLAGGDDDHEVRASPATAPRRRRPPSSGSTTSSPSPGRRCATRRTRPTTRSCGCSTPRPSATPASRRRARSAASARFQRAGPPSVSGRSSASGSLNHGTALHSHGLYSRLDPVRCRRASARPRTATSAPRAGRRRRPARTRAPARSASRRPGRSSSRSEACRRGRARSRPAGAPGSAPPSSFACVAERGVVAHAHQLEVPHAEVEVGDRTCTAARAPGSTATARASRPS